MITSPIEKFNHRRQEKRKATCTSKHSFKFIFSFSLSVGIVNLTIAGDVRLVIKVERDGKVFGERKIVIDKFERRVKCVQVGITIKKSLKDKHKQTTRRGTT